MPGAQQTQEESSRPGASLRARRRPRRRALSLAQFCGRERGHLIRTLRRRSFVWLWLGEAVSGEASSREERPALVPAPAGRLQSPRSLSAPATSLDPTCLCDAFFHKVLKRRNKRGPGAGIPPLSMCCGHVHPPARDATSLEGLGPQTGLNALVTHSAAGPSPSTCHPADVLPWCLCFLFDGAGRPGRAATSRCVSRPRTESAAWRASDTR